MKVVELFIDDTEDMAGGSSLAMVSSPAHESDFVAFNEEKSLPDNNTEIVPTEEQQEGLLHQFSKLGTDQQQFLMKGYIIKDVETIGLFNMNYLQEKFGAININERPIDDVLQDKSIMDYSDGDGNYKVRYRYAARPGRPSTLTTSRKFCKDMISANKTYRLEDINKVLNGFKTEYPGSGNWGDSFFRFGGPNCGHIWVKVTYQEIFKKKDPNPKYITTDEQDDSEAALIAGTNMNEKTLENPSPQTIKRAGLGQFSSQEITKFNEELAKKYQVAGAVLIPDKLIYRRDPKTNEEFYVFFSPKSVETIAYKYIRDKNNNNSNIEHNSNQPINNVSLVESWIIEDPEHDKSNQYGFKLAKGTWFGIVDFSKNQKFYTDFIEKGKVQGFSLEGYFESKLVKFYENQKNNSNIDVDTYILTEIENLLNTD